ncbi:16S rRNA (uracil(1498)-N(3))-methyltransferase [filamentous cyanobacterium LEGE 11480]|uniref:Ribosomal RNA small subunit methyltransferase E n=1 Tax=Romeriopsis navalis LEGE 11480 TaxID=2777977 RepID=A0A928VPF1_9CYAN|nr:16S rRNA (uracil(1498)-N(3))-methyltransferase [Romeriopsis navalis]MBE9032353.1 16S rRNA (uracil(1498)-N(3))-methyltransferase [Romeriopsis navalis LEGE 11480]
MAQLQRVVVSPAQIQDGTITLEKTQSHYLQRVLRLKVGDRFIAMDGQGQTWLAKIGETVATIIEPVAVDSELPHWVTLAIALPKGSGFDEVVRQVSELGVARIVPIISERTLLQPNAKKQARWQKIAAEAAEQSERSIVPLIAEPIQWKKYLQSEPSCGQRFLCWERGDSPALLDALPQAAVELAIGPEGGWTTAEVEAAVAVGYQPVSLGKRILRAVTAAVAVMAIVAAAQERCTATGQQ